MPRGLKQFLYGLLYVALAALLGILAWRTFFFAPATCTDNIQNQGEAGVDCGGPCTPCEIKALAPLQVFTPYTLSLSTGQAIALFAVANPNSTYHAARFAYHVDVFDRGGTRIEAFDGTDSLFAGERKYIIESRITARRSNIGRIEISLSNPQWESVAQFSAPTLSLSGVMTEMLPRGSIRVAGSVANTGGIAASNVHVLAVAFDKYGGRIFAAQNVLTSLVGFENASFTIPFPTDTVFQNIDTARTQVFVSGQ